MFDDLARLQQLGVGTEFAQGTEDLKSRTFPWRYGSPHEQRDMRLRLLKIWSQGFRA